MRREATRNPLVLAIGVGCLAIALAGCAGLPGSGTSPGSSSGPQSVEGQWRLVSGTDSHGRISPGTSVVTLTLNGRNSGGEGPCNAYGIREKGTTTGPISTTVGIHTDMACVDPLRNATEARYFGALDAITRAAIHGRDLELTGKDVTLVFEPSS